MVGKLVVLITASAALIAADTSDAQARTNAGAAPRSSPASHRRDPIGSRPAGGGVMGLEPRFGSK